MNDDNLNDLFAKARTQRPDTSHAEYGFETRLLARLREENQPTQSWSLISWRLVPACAIMVLLLGIVNWQMVSLADQAGESISLNSPEAADLWNAFN